MHKCVSTHIHIHTPHWNKYRCFLFFKILFIYWWETQTEAETETEGEAGSSQGAWCGTQFSELGIDEALNWRQTLNHWATQAPLRLYLFTCERESTRWGRAEGAGDTDFLLSREPNGRLHPRTWDHDPSQRQMLNGLGHLDASDAFLNVRFLLITSVFLFSGKENMIIKLCLLILTYNLPGQFFSNVCKDNVPKPYRIKWRSWRNWSRVSGMGLRNLHFPTRVLYTFMFENHGYSLLHGT